MYDEALKKCHACFYPAAKCRALVILRALALKLMHLKDHSPDLLSETETEAALRRINALMHELRGCKRKEVTYSYA